MEPFKNLFNPKLVDNIALAIKRGYPKFDGQSFKKGIESDLSSLELKDRVNHITLRLRAHLPNDPKKFIPILVGALKKNEQDLIGLDSFSLWPLTHLISLYGQDNFEISMNALKEMTKLFTSEFAVRSFFINDQKRALDLFKIWANDENEHVRRLVSEGSRPLLPWGQKLYQIAENPKLTWGFLEKLKNDPSLYVRKSVANHVNDHSKNHPDFVIEQLLKWHYSKQKSPEVTWVIKHAIRSLIKKGFKKAFILHGVDDLKIEVINQKIVNKKIKLGENLRVKVVLKNFAQKTATIILDHEIHLLKSNNSHGIKVFKGKKMTLNAEEVIELEMSIPLKIVTTRVYYPGPQYWNIKINGESFKPQLFSLKLV